MSQGKAVRTPKAPNLRIQVTQKLIEEAIPKDSGHCMIADAVGVALPDSTHRAIDLQTIRVTDPSKGLRYTYLTPRIAQEALVRFDMGIKPPPFSFLLRGGQVTRANAKQFRKKESDPKKLEVRRKGAAKMIALNRARLKNRTRPGLSATEVPDRVGGKTPPVARHADGVPYSRRREFGVRAMSVEKV